MSARLKKLIFCPVCGIVIDVETTTFSLNSEQQKAVYDTEGAILVIAGAGSGKTRVLTARICHLIDMGVDPYNILAITFTNKAANEMKERIATAIGNNAVWTSTFHSMCARILRYDADKLGYEKNFTIYTELESERVVKRVCADYPEADPKNKGTYLWHISRAKTYSLSPAEYYERIRTDETSALIIAQVYKRYEEELKKSNSMDFDDLLLKTIELFEKFPETAAKYQNRFRYINVDEFQDTNQLQYKLVKLLSAKHGNLFVVGDEDQSIYSWRGAEIRNILDFHKDFPNTKTYKLEQNYRSTTSILEAANNIIKNNANRNAKTLWSENKADDSVEYYEAYSDRDESQHVSRAIATLVNNGYRYRDMAVLVRANSLTRTFEEDFNIHGIPYKVFGGFRFYERKEIKDALAYVRLAINPSDNDSILRVINYPKRGIGNTAVQEIISVAADNNTTLYSVLLNTGWLSNTTAKKIASFADTVKDLIAAVPTMTAVEFMQYVVRRSGLENALATSTDPDDANRLENIQELVSAVMQFQADNPEMSIEDFMQSVALVSDTDGMDGDDYVTIATVHAVKGLEFDTVFIIGCEEGIFPTARAMGSGDIEEERRLMYVAITRARKKLFVTNARSRYRFGRTEYFPKSRFVLEMSGGKQSMRYTNSSYGADGAYQPQIKLGANNPNASIFKNRLTGGFEKSSLSGSVKPKSVNTVNYDEYKKDTLVEHNKFGRGIIIQTSGEGEDKIASIAFKGLGVKRFSLAIAASSLTIVK